MVYVDGGYVKVYAFNTEWFVVFDNMPLEFWYLDRGLGLRPIDGRVYAHGRFRLQTLWILNMGNFSSCLHTSS